MCPEIQKKYSYDSLCMAGSFSYLLFPQAAALGHRDFFLQEIPATLREHNGQGRD